MRAND